MRLLFLSLLLLVPAAKADWAASSKSFAIVARKAPCYPNVLELIPEEHREAFKAAEGIFPDKKLTGCWAPLENGTAVFIWEDGSYGWLPQNKFRELKAV